ncbi:MAG: ABC transporter permease [Bacteroidales bacterium]|nr:ABC transporter permease [Bacteroidales bacterium]
MFDVNTWQEIFNTIRKNKLRTILTGFSIAWGIFMLMLLLGSGNGLKHGVMENFSSETKNVISLWPGRTNIATEGLQKGRRIRFDDQDVYMLENQFDNTDLVSPVISQYTTISYKNDYVTYSLEGVMPQYNTLQSIPLYKNQGRFINEIDHQEKRKVIVLEKSTVEILFKHENPIGKYVNANNIPFQVIGVYDQQNPWWGVEAFIPFSTAQTIFNITDYPELTFEAKGLNTLEENIAYNDLLRSRFARLHSFDPKDNRALWIRNRMKNYIETMSLFGSINTFIWIIGIGTLIAGIVGVSNIMLISVKERTREFGIRKAVGATPFSILRLVVMESLLITTIFGYVGLVAGVAITETINYFMLQNGGGESGMVIFKNPTVDMGIAVSATVVLIIFGVLAGYFPARKAVKIKPIEALRYE